MEHPEESSPVNAPAIVKQMVNGAYRPPPELDPAPKPESEFDVWVLKSILTSWALLKKVHFGVWIVGAMVLAMQALRQMGVLK